MPLSIDSIVGWVVKSGKILNVSDAYECPHFNPQTDRATGFKTNSVLCAPILNAQQSVIGCVQVLNKDNHQIFNKKDVQIVTAFASQAALALENERLKFERQLQSHIAKNSRTHGYRAILKGGGNTPRQGASPSDKLKVQRSHSSFKSL